VARGGAAVRVDGLTWTPTRRRRPVLADVALDIGPGERVILCGPSGAGKSTLLRALAGLLLTADDGDLEGEVTVGGRPAGELPGDVALLLQDPAAAVVAETVGRDVAFGLENRALPRDQIWPRVRQALHESAFPYDVDRPTTALSGGELQRLALAGCVALGPRLMLLDEPTSMLDDAAADAVREAVMRSVAANETTLVVVEHRLEPWLGFADRLVALERTGRIAADGPPGSVLSTLGDRLASEGVWAPGRSAPRLVGLERTSVEPAIEAAGALVAAERLTVSVPTSLVDARRRQLALRNVDAVLTAGEALAVRGPSGSGKSTLLTALAGLLRPTSGRVEAAASLATRRGRVPWRWRSRELAARLAWSPQAPEQGIVARTVREEVRASGRAVHGGSEHDHRADALLEQLGLAELADASPYHLSGGEQRRMSLAAALAHGPAGVLLDEPTVGQDRNTWAAVVGALASARDAGAAVALATHDALAIDALSGRTLELRGGERVR
jgi:energy-coupling factor transport system ATP-binding protein